MSKYLEVQQNLRENPRRWLVTGVAGFIGSNLAEELLQLGQIVIGLDNFSTGHRHNLDAIKLAVGKEKWANFTFIEGDIKDYAVCEKACEGVQSVLHQAALGSVPRSMKDPVSSHDTNVTGFLHMLTAAKNAKVRNFVYASSSSVYGDHPDLPKVEDKIGQPLSPYAATKAMNEHYAKVYNVAYGFQSTGLRYFNVFGKRQDPEGAYAAVMPKWFAGLVREEEIFINGDGGTSRDFCYIDNAVQANILAGSTDYVEATSNVYNVACGKQTTLNELFEMIRSEVSKTLSKAANHNPIYRDFRPGDVLHSLADTSNIEKALGYSPTHSVEEGLDIASKWYVANIK